MRVRAQRTVLLMAAIAISFSSFAQSKNSAALPAHFPKEKTEASLKSWAKQYPAEATKYMDNLYQQLVAVDQATTAGHQKYNELKGEYRIIAEVVPHQPAANNGGAKSK